MFEKLLLFFSILGRKKKTKETCCCCILLLLLLLNRQRKISFTQQQMWLFFVRFIDVVCVVTLTWNTYNIELLWKQTHLLQSFQFRHLFEYIFFFQSCEESYCNFYQSFFSSESYSFHHSFLIIVLVILIKTFILTKPFFSYETDAFYLFCNFASLCFLLW